MLLVFRAISGQFHQPSAVKSISSKSLEPLGNQGFYLFDGGTGPTTVAGAQIGTDNNVYWNAGATMGALWLNSTFFSPTSAKPLNI
jgi:hypothetical protein